MNLCLFLSILAVAFEYGYSDVIRSQSSSCVKNVLQSDINYTKIGGVWRQTRFTGATEFQEMKCYNLKIHNINTETATFHMDSRFNFPAGGKEVQGLSHDAFIVFDRMTSWGQREEGLPYIGDHVASDYENYLIFYQCDDNGKATVDVELKEGVDELSPAKTREVADLLAEINVDYFTLTPVDQTTCDYPK